MKCKIKAEGCSVTYEKWTGHIQRQGVCQNPACLLEKSAKNKAKKEARTAQKQRLQDSIKREDLKSIKELLNDAQVYCNRYILLRDTGYRCISCDTTSPYVDYAAGHYIARGSGANSALRFHPFNINRQCNNHCNKNKSGNVLEYRKRLLKKIGSANVDYLENHPYPYRYTREDAIEIKQHFMAECRRLKKELL